MSEVISEKRIPSPFELISLVETIFPSKGSVDYINVTTEELIERFNNEIIKSGFDIEESKLANIRKDIKDFHSVVYDRKSNLQGADSNKKNRYDQNNYVIQSSLSILRNITLQRLADQKTLGISLDVDEVVSVPGFEEFKKRLNKESVREYVTEVLTNTWEQYDSLQLDSVAVTHDIFNHFGIFVGGIFDGEKKEVFGLINHLNEKSDNYGVILNSVAFKITEIVLGCISDVYGIEAFESTSSRKKH